MTSIQQVVPSTDPTSFPSIELSVYPTVAPSLFPTMSPTTYKWPLQSLILVITIPSLFIMMGICIFYCYYHTNKNSLVHSENEQKLNPVKNEQKSNPIETHYHSSLITETNVHDVNSSPILVEGFIYPSGNTYSGTFLEGKKHGHGSYTYYNGNSYVGDFFDDLPNGQGLFTYDNGVHYDGQWSNGKQHGEGTYFYPNGEKYFGHNYEGCVNQHDMIIYMYMYICMITGNQLIDGWMDESNIRMRIQYIHR